MTLSDGRRRPACCASCAGGGPCGQLSGVFVGSTPTVGRALAYAVIGGAVAAGLTYGFTGSKRKLPRNAALGAAALAAFSWAVA